MGISETTLRNLTSQGNIPYYKFGRRNRYVRNELTQLLLEHRKGTSKYWN
ncbi:MAG: DNA-binding protein [Proteobacteria bacterium]|nr:MAG: DNA-binding protein [Pseudomonadota bacterium]